MKYYTEKSSAVQAVISTAVAYLGTKEGSVRHHNIIDSYNSVSPKPRGYKVTYNDAWCATFVTYCFDSVGLSDLMVRECGANEMRKKMKELSLISTLRNENTYSRGNIIFYDWDSNGISDHVGIIHSVNPSANVIKVIEGNKNDSVDYRTIAINSTSIQGFGVIDYEKAVKQYDYENIGWNKDNNGWWYAYGHTKNEYYKNQAKTINGQTYLFNSNGYVVDGKKTTFNSNGSLKNIEGEKIGK